MTEMENELGLTLFGSIVMSCSLLTGKSSEEEYWKSLKRRQKSFSRKYNTVMKAVEKIASDFGLTEEMKMKLCLLTDLRGVKTPLVCVLDNNAALPLFRDGTEAGLVKDYNDSIREAMQGITPIERCQAEWLYGVEEEDD